VTRQLAEQRAEQADLARAAQETREQVVDAHQ
jgi:hypothetical protein